MHRWLSQLFRSLSKIAPLPVLQARQRRRLRTTSLLHVELLEERLQPSLASAVPFLEQGLVLDQSDYSTFLAVVGPTILHQTGQASTIVSVDSSLNPTVFGQAVTFTASITALAQIPATGSVVFTDGSTTLGTGQVSNDTATFSTTSLAAATHSITAAYSGDSSYLGSSATLTQTVNKASTSTSLSSSANPSVFGQDVTFTATVSALSPGAGTPTGKITFEDGTTTLGSSTLSGGSATFSTSGLAVRSHSITATYGGDSNFTTSASATLTQTVNQASSSTSLASSTNPSVFGQAVTFTATVSAVRPGAGTPTGTVVFTDGTTTLGSSTLSGGSATFSTSGLAVRSHSITASYGGDSNFTTSASATLTQTVNQASSSTSLALSTPTSVFGQTVTFTAIVTAVSPGVGTPTGTVVFEDVGTSIGNGTLSGGTATFSTSTLSVGSHGITAAYGGDSNFTTSASATLTQTVNQASSSTSLASSAPTTVFGQSVTFTATVGAVIPGAGTPTGTVVFDQGATSIGSSTLSTGIATFSTSTLSVGSHSITAAYGGDSNFTTSASATLTQTVNQDSSSTSLASATPTSVFGQRVTFIATVTAVSPGAGTPTGKVEFADLDVNDLGTGTLSGGVATFAIGSLSVGSHSLLATYLGDSNFSESFASAIVQTVDQANSSTSLSSSAFTVALGQAVTFAAFVTAVSPGEGTPTGSVSFSDDGNGKIGTGVLSGGTATFSTNSLSVGNHLITATYGADTNFSGSLSQAITEVITKDGTNTSLMSSANSVPLGTVVTFTAMVSSPGPTTFDNGGTVTFKDGGSSFGTGTVSGGLATFSTSTLGGGTHTVTATYSGDSNFSGSTSATLTETVNRSSSSTALASSTATSAFGQGVTFTATVSGTGGTPAGMVTFEDGGTSIGTGTLGSGMATFAINILAGGTHSITAVYNGDSNFSGSTSGTLTQFITRAPSSTSLTSSAQTASFGNSGFFTVFVSAVSTPSQAPVAAGPQPSGTVTFEDGGTPFNTTPFSNGSAVFFTDSLAVGTHTVTAVYGGDGNFSGSVSNPIIEVITPAG